MARMIHQLNDEENGTNWREGNGRPEGSGTKKQAVEEYITGHPEATVSEVAKALGISRTTVYKYKNIRPKKKRFDYLVDIGDGVEILVQSDEALSEYDQRRMARLKAHNEFMAKQAAELEKNEEMQ